jgi:hypothetical protein
MGMGTGMDDKTQAGLPREKLRSRKPFEEGWKCIKIEIFRMSKNLRLV